RGHAISRHNVLYPGLESAFLHKILNRFANVGIEALPTDVPAIPGRRVALTTSQSRTKVNDIAGRDVAGGRIVVGDELAGADAAGSCLRRRVVIDENQDAVGIIMPVGGKTRKREYRDAETGHWC